MFTKVDLLNEFAQDVLAGLSTKEKAISSKYFYDEKGDQLFQQIMGMPEYYLTRCEFEIFKEQHQTICMAMKAFDEPFNLIEFGAGDGFKTKLLLQYLLEQSADFTYYPVDISQNILSELSISLKGMFPGISISQLNMDYFAALKQMKDLNPRRNIILFLGSNVGNFHLDQAEEFICRLKQSAKKGDMLMLGVDLRKDPEIIINAYDDPAGITSAFNLNLLSRMNRELGADFNVRLFRHHTYYHEETGEVRSYIESIVRQLVTIDLLNLKIDFQPGEKIHTEISRKYSLNELTQLAKNCNFRVIHHFLDNKKYFTDTLWEIN